MTNCDVTLYKYKRCIVFFLLSWKYYYWSISHFKKLILSLFLLFSAAFCSSAWSTLVVTWLVTCLNHVKDFHIRHRHAISFSSSFFRFPCRILKEDEFQRAGKWRLMVQSNEKRSRFRTSVHGTSCETMILRTDDKSVKLFGSFGACYQMQALCNYEVIGK